MDAAENDELGIGPAGGHLREFERIATDVGVFDNFVSLVVMSEDDHLVAQRFLGAGNCAINFFGRHRQIMLWDPDLFGGAPAGVNSAQRRIHYLDAFLQVAGSDFWAGQMPIQLVARIDTGLGIRCRIG